MTEPTNAEPTNLAHVATRFDKEIAFDDGVTKTSYGQLLRTAYGGIQSLRDCGLGQGDRVIWCPANDLKTLQTFWSLLLMGCVSCPVSDRFPDDKLAEIEKQLDAKWLPGISFEPNDSVELPRLAAHDPATITLSSGSTGQPKAIVHSLAAHVANAVGAATNMPLGVGNRWLWSLPTYHVSGFSVLVRCAVGGATIVGTNRETDLTPQLLESSSVTHLSVVSTQLRRLMAGSSFPNSSLKAVLLGGSSVPRSLVELARERGVPVHSTYGLTETASQVTTSTTDCDPSTSGCVLPHRELKVDSTGEILVRGETLCLGYLHDGQVESVVDAAGWFHTRDRGSTDANGRLTVSGRIDNMFISGGENIYPETIERALLEIPGITQAIVVPRDNAEFGARPVAFVDGELGDAAALANELRRTLRGFEVPVEFLVWPEVEMVGIKPSRSYFHALAQTQS